MVKLIFGVFVVLHGLVHLLYAGQSRRLFELAPGLGWPDGSWSVSGLVGDGVARGAAAFACVAAAIVFAGGGVGLLAGRAWWRPAVVVAAVVSAATYLVFWNGGLQRLPDQGAVGILISGAIAAVALAVRWPALGS